MSDNDDQNLIDFSENVIIHLKKPELVKKKIELKGRVTVDVDICGLWDEIKNLSETVTQLLDKHELLNSELLLYKKVNKHLEEKVTKLIYCSKYRDISSHHFGCMLVAITMS